MTDPLSGKTNSNPNDNWSTVAEAEAIIERLRAALGGLLCEMALEYDGNRKYDVYQVTKGAVTEARKALGPAQET